MPGHVFKIHETRSSGRTTQEVEAAESHEPQVQNIRVVRAR